jgi:rubredoxin
MTRPSSPNSPDWRTCHVCDHRYDIEAPRGLSDRSTRTRPLLCPRCGVIGRNQHITLYLQDLIFYMYGIAGGTSMDTRSYHVLVHALLYAIFPANVERAVGALLRIDAAAIADYAQPSGEPEDEAARLQALEWIRKDVPSGLHEWRLRDLGAQAITDLHAEREYHLELLRRREAAGLR